MLNSSDSLKLPSALVWTEGHIQLRVVSVAVNRKEMPLDNVKQFACINRKKRVRSSHRSSHRISSHVISSHVVFLPSLPLFRSLFLPVTSVLPFLASERQFFFISFSYGGLSSKDTGVKASFLK